VSVFTARAQGLDNMFPFQVNFKSLSLKPLELSRFIPKEEKTVRERVGRPGRRMRRKYTDAPAHHERTVRGRVARQGREMRRVCVGTPVHYEHTVRERVCAGAPVHYEQTVREGVCAGAPVHYEHTVRDRKRGRCPAWTAMPSMPIIARRPCLRGLHSFTLKLNLSTFGTHSWVKLGYVGHKDSST